MQSQEDFLSRRKPLEDPECAENYVRKDILMVEGKAKEGEIVIAIFIEHRLRQGFWKLQSEDVISKAGDLIKFCLKQNCSVDFPGAQGIHQTIATAAHLPVG